MQKLIFHDNYGGQLEKSNFMNKYNFYGFNYAWFYTKSINLW